MSPARRPAKVVSAGSREGACIETDLTALRWEQVYSYLISSVVPRPIAWVSTLSAGGIPNIAPFSFFNAFAANPPILGFAPMYASDRTHKDTLANIRATRNFVINVATEATLERMDTTGLPWPADADEFLEAKLTPAPSVSVTAPRIAESPINFECELFSLVPLGDGPGSSTLVLGRAVHVRIADDVLREGRIDPALLKPVARMGGPLYARPDLLAYTRQDRRE